MLSLCILLMFGSTISFHFQLKNFARSSLSSSSEISDYENRPGPWDEADLASLLVANRAWSKKVREDDPGFFEEIKKGHSPKILWIGCSDARVPANEIIGQPPGSVFVHRNVANQVVNTDVNCMSVVQYAVDVLKVKHIIVCGHYDCGGIRAALELKDHRSPLENWLRNIRDVVRLHKSELNNITDSNLLNRRLVELNVEEQCLNIFKTAVVQKRRVETYKQIGVEGSRITFAEPRVHAFVYEPTTGEAKMLPVDFYAYLKDLRSVYDLYNIDKETRDEIRIAKRIAKKEKGEDQLDKQPESVKEGLSSDESEPVGESVSVQESESSGEVGDTGFGFFQSLVKRIRRR